jgi:putative two-component system response regulator
MERENTELLMAALAAVLNLAECRDDIAGRHIERTSLYCKLLAVELQKVPRFSAVITDDFVVSIHNAAPLHDIGKIAISDSVLLKEGRLSEAEFAVMKTHVTIGVQILQRVRDSYPKNGFISMGIALTGSHHERWDGRGYPNGLFGENIPISGRIMALADSYDALRSRRPYKDPLTREESLRVIGDESGKQFDPAVVAAFLANEPRFAEISARDNGDQAAWRP